MRRGPRADPKVSFLTRAAWRPRVCKGKRDFRHKRGRLLTRYRFSAAQTLSLASTAIVAAVLGIAVIVVWATLTRAAINDARVGLDRSVRQLAMVTASGVRTTQVRFARVAEDAAIRNALASPEPQSLGAARATLRRLDVRPDSGLPIELWSETGRRLGSVGTDSGETIGLNIPAEAPEPESIRGRGLDSLRIVDSVQIGELQRVGGRTLFWLVMPVRDGDKLLGFVATRRHIASNPQTEATIRELSGNSAAGYYRNADGSTWTSFGGFPESPRGLHPIQRRWKGGTYSARGTRAVRRSPGRRYPARVGDGGAARRHPDGRERDRATARAARRDAHSGGRAHHVVRGSARAPTPHRADERR